MVGEETADAGFDQPCRRARHVGGPAGQSIGAACAGMDGQPVRRRALGEVGGPAGIVEHAADERADAVDGAGQQCEPLGGRERRVVGAGGIRPVVAA